MHTKSEFSPTERRAACTRSALPDGPAPRSRAGDHNEGQERHRDLPVGPGNAALKLPAIDIDSCGPSDAECGRLYTNGSIDGALLVHGGCVLGGKLLGGATVLRCSRGQTDSKGQSVDSTRGK